jgi:shikimate dehydrogenase
MREFGLIGKSLKHSFSKSFFEEKFSKEQLSDCLYELFELNAINEFPDLIKRHPNFVGLNVTIPYKEEIIPFLDELDATAKAIGAVNTIRIHEGKLTGFNTDTTGFSKSIRPFLEGHHERALILGTGGAAKAVAHALKQLGINCLFVSRNPQNEQTVRYEDIHPEGLAVWPLIINCTPTGMFPQVNEHPNLPMEAIGPSHFVVDLIYNPAETQLLKSAKDQGAIVLNGLDMLKFQALDAWEIWNH